VPVKLALKTANGKTALSLSGASLGSFELTSGCAISPITLKTFGEIVGTYANAASQFEFNAETSKDGLRFQNATTGPKGTAVGSVGLKTTAAGYISAVNSPVAITEAASAIQPAEATLNGSVNPEGTDAHYQFEYGETTSYGKLAPAEAKDAGEGLANVKVAETIKGLVPGTQYHYRLMATNGTSTGYGADMTFTTTTVPLH
jgi:phosphodiesterase/alkaline phosphatase D-like protein